MASGKNPETKTKFEKLILITETVKRILLLRHRIPMAQVYTGYLWHKFTLFFDISFRGFLITQDSSTGWQTKTS